LIARQAERAYSFSRADFDAPARRLGAGFMNRQFVRRMLTAEAESILDYLSQQQHVHPHSPVRTVLEHTVVRLGLCRRSAGRSIRWLGVDDSTSIGRLRRTELMQLARCVHRFCRQAAADAKPEQWIGGAVEPLKVEP
jgi:hypothetical protein